MPAERENKNSKSSATAPAKMSAAPGSPKANRPESVSQTAAQNESTWLSHAAALDIYSDPDRLRKTSIICTIGPKTASVEMITKLRAAGMNVVRMNFSHGSHEYHGGVVDATRESVKTDPLEGKPVAIALDTKGPEIRTGLLEGGDDVELVKGSTVTVTTDAAFKEKCTADKIYMDYANLPKVMPAGGLMYVDDGLITLQVDSIDGTELKCTVVNTGMLGSKKGVNLPDVEVDLPALSEKDKSDLKFGVEKGVDMVFASFIRKRSDVLEVRECLGEKGANIKIISKIENHEGVRNFDDILEVTDGVMVARGDLGIEIAPEKVFLAQKMMIAKCNMAGKPVICATQMLESMTKNPRPTRAEVSDVANAVLDGADCVMLSGETAKGAYPEAAVSMMSNICSEAESAVHYKSVLSAMRKSFPPRPDYLSVSESTAFSIATAAETQNISAIITLSTTGGSMKYLSKFRPACPIIVVSRDAQVCRQSHLHRGCYAIEYPEKSKSSKMSPGEDRQNRIDFGMKIAIERGYVQAGQTVIVASGRRGKDGVNTSLCSYEVHTVA